MLDIAPKLAIWEKVRLTWRKPAHSLPSRHGAGSQGMPEAAPMTPSLVHNQLKKNHNRIVRPESLSNRYCCRWTCHWICTCFPSTPIANKSFLSLAGSGYSAITAALFRVFAAGIALLNHGLHLMVLIDGVQHTISCSHGLFIHVLLTWSLSLAGKCGS